MDDEKLAYRIRTAEPGDDAALRSSIRSVLAHPDRQGKRESYRGAAERGDLLILERHDRQEKVWRVEGFVEFHMRVDDTLSIRDMGTASDAPTGGVVRYLLDELFGSFKPAAAQVKVRTDAADWLEIVRSISGFYLEGQEYRRPHYWGIWRWDRERARAAAQPRAVPQPPRRPAPPPPPPRSPSGPRGGTPLPGGRPPGPGRRSDGPGSGAGPGRGRPPTSPRPGGGRPPRPPR